jgi:diguanylate cyclase (GGDEF)-like protein/PAS domain S-box-containing protein
VSRQGKLALSFALALGVIVALRLISSFAIDSVVHNAQQSVARQDQVIAQSLRVQEGMATQEASLYRYLATGRASALTRFRQGRVEVNNALRAATASSALSRNEAAILRSLPALVRQWNRWALPLIAKRGRASIAPELDRRRAAAGPQILDLFAHRVDAVNAAFRNDQAHQVQASSRLFTRFNWLGMVFTLLAVGIVGLLAWSSVRILGDEDRARRRAVASETDARDTTERYRSLIDSSPDAIVLVDPQSDIIMANDRAVALFGCQSLADFRKLSLDTRMIEADRPRALEAMNRRLSLQEPIGYSMEYRFSRQDGTEFPSEVSSSAVVDGQGHVTGVMRVIRDISDRKAIETELVHQATHDSLTHLPNRGLFDDRINQAIQTASRAQAGVAMLLLDLNRFKEVNDTFGHHVGDALLKDVAARLASTLRDSDSVARLGGDEFAVLLPNTNVEQATTVAEKVRSCLAQPFAVAQERFAVEASVGIAVYPIHGESAETLLRCADVAMYAAKRGQVGCTVYQTSIDSYDPRRIALLADLHEALEMDQLQLHYQPKVDMQTGKVHAVEALVRWHHAVHGYVPPAEFIPLVERTDLIKPFTLWVLRRALADCRKWRDLGSPLTVAVNLSAWNIHDDDLPRMTAQLLREFQLPANLLRLEVTETAVMTDPVGALAILNRLSALGVSLSLDDFGTGYSSLAYLKRMPVDEIKIDQSFVQDMIANEDDAAIVRSVVSLGHSLKLEVVAEGVEDSRTLELLAQNGCDLSQGFYLGRPMHPTDLALWLEAWDREGAAHLPWVTPPVAALAS